MTLVQRMLFWQRWVPAKADESARVRALIDAHADAIHRTARRLGVVGADLEDVAQDVLVVLVRRHSDIDAEKEHAFVVGTTLRVIANFRRRQRRRAEDLTDDVDQVWPGPERGPRSWQAEERVEQARLLELLGVALDRMTEAQRLAFVLFELEECTARETAAALGVSEATVVSRVRRAREVVWAVRDGIDAGASGGPRRNSNGADE